MDPNVLLLLKLFELAKSTTAAIQAIKDHDPAAYAQAEAHHKAAGIALDQAKVP